MNESIFNYDSFTVSDDRKRVDFTYTSNHGSDKHNFTESYNFGVALPDSLEVFRLLRALHLVAGISYYKTFVNSDIEHPYAMSTREAGFWNNIFKNGLGEFLYVNKIDPAKLAVFGPQEGADTKNTTRIALEQKALLGIGGGKDSIVAGELLKAIGVPVTGFVLGTGDATGQTKQVAKTMKIDLLSVARTLDKTLLTVQQQPDAYRGHVPISVFFALVGCLLAVATKKAHVIVANESSASIPRAHWADTDVNHQYSKSFAFEQLMQNYLHDHVSQDLWYFSAIRPLSSVAIAKIFAGYPDYFTNFTSDNYAFRVDASKRPNDRWSLESPKSLSSYILLSAWLNKNQLVKIFGRDLLDMPRLEPMFFGLTGIEGDQPLDCVGTPSELRASLGQAYQNGTCKDSILMLTGLHCDIIDKDKLLQPTVEHFLKTSAEQAFAPSLAAKLQKQISEVLA